jgi:ankyrin repeat protein
MMGTEQTAQVVRQFYEAIGRGDGAAIMACLDPDVVFELPRDEHNRIIPYLGTKRGHREVAEAFRIRGETTEVLSYEVRGYVVENDQACAIVYTRARCRATREEFEIEDMHHLTVNPAGRIARWKVYFDPNTEVAAFRRGINDRLLAAVTAGDSAAVGRILDDGADANARDPNGMTALMLAAGRGNAQVAGILLARGADALAVEPRAGNSVLHVACQGGSTEVVRLLLDAGAMLNSVAASTGHTPLMDALWYKWPEIVELLLDRGAGLNMRTHYGFTLDEHVQYEERVNVFGQARFRRAKEAIERRRRSDQAMVDGQPLMAAVIRGDLAAVKAQLGAGAKVDERYPLLNGFNDGHTPLLVACRDGHAEIATELTAAGADVNAVEPTFGAVPLHKAVYNGHNRITRALVRLPKINLNFRGATNGYTPLHDALWHGHLESAEALVDAGADTTIPGNDGKLPADIAAEVFGADAPIVARLRRPPR